MKNGEYKVCTRCVMDSSDLNLHFDSHGVCERCREYESSILPEWNHGKGHEAELKALLEDIRRKGRGRKYDCILGLSGGLDSSYLLHLTVREWGLRPFVFHINCGWNLPVAEQNIMSKRWTGTKCARCRKPSSAPACPARTIPRTTRSSP